jgi:hypothetical protein
MKPELIALVFMGDDQDNFFIENPPPGRPEAWIDKFVNDVADVEFVQVFERGSPYAYWSNPNSNPEP